MPNFGNSERVLKRAGHTSNSEVIFQLWHDQNESVTVHELLENSSAGVVCVGGVNITTC